MMVGRMLRQKDFKFATKLGYIARPCIMKKKKKKGSGIFKETLPQI